MSRIGIIGGTVVVAALASTVLCYHPSYASDALLAKAQLEFTAKARDAVLQRRMARPSTASDLAFARQHEPAQTYVLASLEPVAPPPVTPREKIDTAAAPISTVVTKEVVETPVLANEMPELPKAVVSSEIRETEVKPELAPLPATQAAQDAIAPTPRAMPEAIAPQVSTPAINPAAINPVVTHRVARQPAKVVQKATQESVRKANSAARHFERNTTGERLPYNIEALRARAPEIAAAIARYM